MALLPSDPSLCHSAGWLLNLQQLTLGERIGQGEFGGEKVGPGLFSQRSTKGITG